MSKEISISTNPENDIVSNDQSALGQAALILARIKEQNTLTAEEGPQHLGILDPEDKQEATKDPRTISANIGTKIIPIFMPIEYHYDANQSLFEGKTTYFFNWQDYSEQCESQIADKMSTIPSGSHIMLEREAGDAQAELILQKLFEEHADIRIELDKDVLDPETNEIPSVIYYYSETHRTNNLLEGYPNISSAYEALKSTETWRNFEKMGVRFVSGEDISPELLNDLWEAYDETFNKLIKNHPSDQKIPREYFDLLTTSVNSKVAYVIDEGEVVCAFFTVENLEDLPWLNAEYYKKLNAKGKTVFMPGIATKLSKGRGLAYSPRLMQAMAYLCNEVPEITGLATQCTNISAQYIPKLTDRYTKGTINLRMLETDRYEYPVYKVI